MDSEDIRCYGGRKAGRIRIQQEKQRLLSKQADALSCKIKQAVLQLPDFSARASSVRRRIHDHRIIRIPPAKLPGYEFEGVVNDLSDPVPRKSGKLSVFARPRNHALRRVHMTNLRARFGNRRRRAARITK